MLINIQAISNGMGKVVYTKDKSVLPAIAEKRKLYQAAMEKLDKMESGKEGSEIFDKLKTLTAEAREANIKLAKLIEGDEWSDAASFYINHAEPRVNKVLEMGGRLCQTHGSRR
ncbi:MAG: hypothetical protein C0392_14610 [Syntrophus sp. (in: bacteria)]|nr:hypothetical protein [Syntrophus sp. (in: bacteria)]